MSSPSKGWRTNKLLSNNYGFPSSTRCLFTFVENMTLKTFSPTSVKTTDLLSLQIFFIVILSVSLPTKLRFSFNLSSSRQTSSMTIAFYSSSQSLSCPHWASKLVDASISNRKLESSRLPAPSKPFGIKKQK